MNAAEQSASHGLVEPVDVPARIAAWAERQPHAVALEHAGERLSYAELVARSNQLAHALRERGVGPEVRVGVLLERSLDMVVALLAVLCTGGAYVPLDPDYPGERLRFVAEDAGLALVITHAAVRAEWLGDAPILALEHAQLERRPVDDPHTVVAPASLAYVIYTSGSTGRPKGVAVARLGLLNLIDRLAEIQPFAPGRRALGYCSVGFDGMGHETWGALGNGATLVLAARSERIEPQRLAALLARVDTASLVPTLVATLDPAVVAPDFCMVVAGEACSPELAARWASRCTLVNCYGPTEATVTAAYARVDAGELAADRPPPIGRAIANVELHVLDERLEPVATGDVGELYIAGVGLARGYLDRPRATAERFVPNPFDESGARMYRSGDRCRVREDGRLELVGRVDHEVKIRGVRIDLGEIEATLREHPQVAEAVVVLAEAGERRLLAHVVPRAGEDLQATHVAKWQLLNEQVYAEQGEQAEQSEQAEQAEHVDLSGWKSSYDGEPIPEHEMREWIEATVAELRALRPRRVLEIGCGSGLLLRRLAPECEAYVGVDFAAEALERIRQRQAVTSGLARVTLVQRGADDLAGIPERAFDVVVMNSVLQAFPSVDYLLRTLDGALARLTPGGTLYVGDVRNLALLPAFHASIQLARASDATRRAELAERVALEVQVEHELLVEPELFVGLQGRSPRVDRVEIRVKRGRHRNELNCFRYQALVHVRDDASTPSSPSAVGWLHWSARGLSVESLRACLLAEQPPILALAGVPDARVSAEARTLAWLSGEHDEPVAALRRELAEPGGVEPDALVELGEALGYRVVARSSDASVGDPTTLDVVFVRRDVDPGVVPLRGPHPRQVLASYANAPLLAQLGRTLPGVLRDFLRVRLPEAMIPAGFALHDVLPRTAADKLDRLALARMDVAPERTSETSEQLPASPLEARLAAIWAEVLGRGRVGVHDDFFALGGDSITAIQVVVRAVQAGLRLGTKQLFERRTVARLAAMLELEVGGAPLEAGDEDLDALVPAELRARVRAAHPGVVDVHPITPMQAGMLFHALHEPDAATYVVQFRIELLGELDEATLETALARVIARHPALRSGLVWRDVPEPLAIVLDRVEPSFAIVDWRGEPADEERARIDRWLEVDRTRPPSPSEPPLLRFAWLRHADDRRHLVLTCHHLLLDGWSFATILDETLEIQRALCAGQTPVLPDPPHFRRYVEWLARRDLGPAREHWRTRLATAGEPCRLALASPTGAEPGTAAIVVDLDAALARSLQRFARSQGLTLATVFQGAWALVLARLCSRRDPCFGVVVSGRPPTLPGVERMVGLFLATLPVSVRIDPRRSLLDWLHALQADVSACQEHEGLALTELHRLAGGRGGVPLFDTVLAFDNYPASAKRPAGFQIGELAVHQQDNHALALVILPGEPLRMLLSRDRRRVDEGTLARVAEQLPALLSAMVADPLLPLARLERLTAGTRASTLAWNDTARPFAHGRDIPERIASWAERTPSAIAVECGGARLCYAELVQHADRLAHVLLERFGPGELVGVMLSRSTELVVALLAVLSAGAAYVPLDPEYPAERLRFMAENARLGALLVDRSTSDRVGEWGRGLPRIVVELEALRQPSHAEPLPKAEPEALAYVIYTSGSTGRPKGVAVARRGLVNLVEQVAALQRLGPGRRALSFCSLAFDGMVHELWGALSSGATLVVATADERLDPRRLEALLAAVDTTALTPTVLATLAPEVVAPSFCMAVAGEACPRELASRWASCCELLNLYGPTEATVTASWDRVDPADERPPSIGRPLANVQLHVLDEQLEPTPEGLEGEIHIAGVGLARGYLGAPGLTAERFLPSPFGGPGARMYRTGDRGRRRWDGRVEFVGRVDHEIKLRGVRVDLGEIEALLRAHPDVAEAAVVVAASGERRLVAHVVTRTTGASVEALREHLRARLPSAVVPAAFVVHATLPSTPNGKLDRAALAAFDVRDELHARAQREPPRNPIEATLASIWAEVLGLAAVGIHDSFFELGGDSLSSIRVVSRAARAGLQLSTRQLFDYPTIAALAERLGPLAAAPPLVRVASIGEAPLTPIQRWFFAQRLAAAHHWNQAECLPIPASWSAERIAVALHRVIETHDALRLAFVEHDGRWRAEYRPLPAHVVVESIDLSSFDSATRAARLEQAATRMQASMRLDQPPLVRALRAAWDHEAARLVLAIHHLVVDTVSWSILREELEALCTAQDRGEADVALEPEASSWQRWAHAQITLVESGALASVRPTWLALVGREPTPLPMLEPQPGTHARVARCFAALDRSTTRALLRAAPRAYATRIDELLLCGLALALREWSGGEVVGLVLEGHGREGFSSLEGHRLERTVGWFTTSFPVVLDLEGLAVDELAALITSVARQLRALPHKGASYGMLRWLDPEGEQLRLPERGFELAFNYNGQQRSVSAHAGSSGLLPCGDPTGPTMGADNHPVAPLAIDCMVLDEVFELHVEWDARRFMSEAVERFAAGFIAALERVVRHCVERVGAERERTEFPLAFAQERIWRIDRREAADPRISGSALEAEPRRPGHVMPLALRLRGTIDLDCLAAAFGVLVERHHALRTTIVERDGALMQRILPTQAIVLTREPLEAPSPEAQQRALADRLADTASMRLDEPGAPMMRASLLVLAPDHVVLSLVIHHALCDGWSFGVLSTELREAYRSLVAGRTPQLEPLPLRLVDHAIEERERLSGDRLARLLEYWRERLRGVAPLELPADRPRPARASGHGRVHVFEPPAALGKRVAELARTSDTTVFAVLLAAWQLYLARRSHSDDVVVGTLVAGRERAELEGLVGCFINLVPLRLELAGAASFAELVRRATHSMLGAFEHQAAPFDAIVEALGPAVVPGVRPLVSVLFMLQNLDAEPEQGFAEGVCSETLVSLQAVSRFDLVLSIQRTATGLRGMLRYATDRFEPPSVERLAGDYVALLERLVAAPDGALPDSEPPSPYERA